MAARPKLTREEQFLKKKNFFRRNAFLVINEMVELNKPHSEEKSLFVDEVLHSIFFLGKINFPEFLPKDIVDNNDMLNALKGRYPEPFNHYSSQLPKRSPISCVLDMIVILTGQKKEDEIIKKLQKLMEVLTEGQTKELVSSTICVSQPDKSQTSVRYYGVSNSTSGPIPGRIVTAASCLRNWDSYVAGAVMGYILKDKPKEKFDGTIRLPKSVRCQAFSLSDGEPMPPCRSCGNLFGLETSETKEWPYGNCAEVESLSNLLKKEEGVRGQVQTTCTEAVRERARESVMKVLEGYVKMVNEKEVVFDWRKKQFYTPQAALL